MAFIRRGGRGSYREVSIDEVRDDICLLEMEFIHFWEFMMNEAEKSDMRFNWQLKPWLEERLEKWKKNNRDSRMP